MEKYDTRASQPTAPAGHGFAIIPDDENDLPRETRAIYVGGQGNLSVTLSSGDEVALVSVPSGAVLPLRAIRIRATGTTATNLVGLH